MSRVFIGYRHIKPDEDLANFLEKHLSSRGHQVFIDNQILVGTKQVEEIERQIRAAKHFVVLLSKASIRSDMVRQEVKLAHQLMRQHQLSILPIRVAFLGELSLDLACLLNPIQYALWEEGKPFESIGAQIFTAIERATALPIPGKSNKEAPSVAGMQSLFEATEADGEMLQQFSRIGATTVVEEPRQMGKSSLLARAFKTSTKPDEFWDSSLGAKENLTDFIEVAILAETSSPIWVMFDEADRVFNFPYRDDFFATLRGWHNLRARREHCRRFNLGIAHYSQRAIYSRRSQNLAGRMAKKAGTAIRRKWQDCTEVSDGAVKR